MKAFTLLLFLNLGFSVAEAQKRRCVPVSQPKDPKVRLQLMPTIAETRYSVEYGYPLVRMTLNLHYVNQGARPILLDKKSSVVYRRIVSKDLKSLSACKYLHDISSHFITVKSMEAVGFRMKGEPERSEFIMLKPGESLDLKNEILLHLYDGTKDTKDELRPGNYVLQVRVAAWFYFADPVEWERKWGNEAYVWSENVTSEPMAFTIDKSKVDAARHIGHAAK